MQEIKYNRIFIDGSRHQIRLRTITLRVIFITREPQHGSSEAVFTRVGKQQPLNRLSGFMENVRPLSYSCLTRTPLDSILFAQLALGRAFYGLWIHYSFRQS